jgi:hypothetical protein
MPVRHQYPEYWRLHWACRSHRPPAVTRSATNVNQEQLAPFFAATIIYRLAHRALSSVAHYRHQNWPRAQCQATIQPQRQPSATLTSLPESVTFMSPSVRMVNAQGCRVNNAWRPRLTAINSRRTTFAHGSFGWVYWVMPSRRFRPIAHVAQRRHQP